MDPRPSESLDTAFGETLAQLAAQLPNLRVYCAASADGRASAEVRRQFPDRCTALDGGTPDDLRKTAETAGPGAPAFVLAPPATFVGSWYPVVRASLAPQRANVKLVAVSGASAFVAANGPPVFDDLALMRTLPGMTVVEPADGSSARSAARAITTLDGPTYVRLAAGARPTVTNGEFEIGRATELRPGTDLTIIAVGALVSRALDVANVLERVGIHARVLDLGSVKPFDEKSVVRAARETGAVLTLEDQFVATGIGALVASATAENVAVPVRRLGILDLDGGPDGANAGSERPELSEERALQEAWELLRLKGKVQ